MPDEPTAVVRQREILHLPKAKLNGTGVVKRPDGEVRHEDMMREQQEPAPADKET